MANVSFHMGSTFPDNFELGGIYISESYGQMYIQTNVGTLLLTGEMLNGDITPGNLAANSWDTIADAARKGIADKLWRVGDTKTFILSNGTEIEVAILGFNHDKPNSITFGMTQCFPNPQQLTVGALNSNNIEDLTGEYIYSDVLPNYFAQFPEDLKSVITPVQKDVYDPNGGWLNNPEFVTLYDSLFLFSAMEVYGDTSSIAAYSVEEGSQYAYYKTAPYRIKYNPNSGYTMSWWLRSFSNFSTLNTSISYYVDSSGGLAQIDSSQSNGICVGFCIS